MNKKNNFSVPLYINSEISEAINMIICKKNRNICKAKLLIEKVISNYKSDIYPSYSHGLAGIGCGIQYLLSMDYIDVESNELLEFIDQNLSECISYSIQDDLSKANGLIGLATYYFLRLESENTNNSSFQILKWKSILLTIFDIVAARFNLNGFSYPAFNNLHSITDQEKNDIRYFLSNCLNHNICNELSVKLLNNMEGWSKSTFDYNLNKRDLSDLTIILVVRIDSQERLNNLRSVIKMYYSCTNAYISVLEADAIQYVNITTNDRVSYVFEKDDSPIFHFTHYKNELIKLSKTKIVSIWDADIIVPLDQLYKSVDNIRNKKSIYSTPYDGICYDVSVEISSLFRNELSMDVFYSNQKSMNYFVGMLSVGGVYIVDKEEYMQLGMENEHFYGWGPEDVERIKRMAILNKPISRINGCIYHLWHPRNLNSRFASMDNYVHAYQELFMICSMSEDKLRAYIDTWDWKS